MESFVDRMQTLYRNGIYTYGYNLLRWTVVLEKTVVAQIDNKFT
jgi:hypothetical protein